MLLGGRKVFEEVESPINGRLTVVKDLAWGTHIMAGGLTQSGGIAEKIWKTTLSRLFRSKLSNHKSLILGLGGGSIAKIIRKLWPESQIIGVDVDPIIIDLGVRYLGLDVSKVSIVVQDAYEFVKRTSRKKHDLICVDMYVGDSFPEKFETEEFLGYIFRSLFPSGVVVFNRLYYGKKINEVNMFEEQLRKVFAKVEVVHPEANVMFVCSR